MVSALVPGSSGQGLSPGQGTLCRVFLGKTLTLTVPLSTQEYKWVPVNCWVKPNKLRGSDLRWTSIPSRRRRNSPSRFVLQKPG